MVTWAGITGDGITAEINPAGTLSESTSQLVASLFLVPAEFCLIMEKLILLPGTKAMTAPWTALLPALGLVEV